MRARCCRLGGSVLAILCAVAQGSLTGNTLDDVEVLPMSPADQRLGVKSSKKGADKGKVGGPKAYHNNVANDNPGLVAKDEAIIEKMHAAFTKEVKKEGGVPRVDHKMRDDTLPPVRFYLIFACCPGIKPGEVWHRL